MKRKRSVNDIVRMLVRRVPKMTRMEMDAVISRLERAVAFQRFLDGRSIENLKKDYSRTDPDVEHWLRMIARRGYL